MNNPVQQTLLGEVTDKYLRFHDQCWLIWGKLGVGPDTQYRLPPHAGELIRQTETRAGLKALFAELFQLDRDVLNRIRQIQLYKG